MTYIVGVIGAAVLFGLFTALRPNREACDGHCPGCGGGGACDTGKRPARPDAGRSAE